MFTDSQFWYNHNPLFPDAHPELRAMHREQPIVFITRRQGHNAFEQTYHFLRDKCGIKEPLLYHTRAGEEKSGIAQKLGVSVAIEDNPKVIIDYAKHGIGVVAIDYPYNDDINQFVYRAKTLGEALVKARSLDHEMSLR